MKKVVQTNNPKSIMVQVVLGNPRIGCDGYGICKFVTKMDVFNLIHPDRLVEAQILMENGYLNILFNKTKMTKATYQTHFSEGVFKVETEIELLETIASHFKYPPSVLARGIYKIIEKGNDIRIEVDLYEIKRIRLPALNQTKYTIKLQA